MRHFRATTLLEAFLVLVGSADVLASGAQDASSSVDFARDVKPILDAHCVSCHGPKKQKADFRVDSYERAMEGSPGGKSIVPGSPGASDFYRRLVSDEAEARMPQKEAPLAPAQIDVIRRWVEQGARAAARPVASHWAYAPPVEPEAPAVKDRAWIRNPIDRFVLAKIEVAGRAPAPEAPKGKLLRRLRLDLSGIPPTAAELDAFETDTSPDAYEREVDRLLASRAFATRLAAWWIRTVEGGAGGPPAAGRWREFVVASFERGKDFREFTAEQIGGALLPRETRERRTGEVWLGRTLDCARCHDHPRDPIAKEEFEAFEGYFGPSDRGRFPRALALGGGEAPANRVGLARWIASADNPLFARVAANRIWCMLFGEGIVPTLDDFGEHGAPPSNRELLDWLALDFAANGWSVKQLVGRIVTSSSYRESARAPGTRLDPDVLRMQALVLARLPGERPARPAPLPDDACTRDRVEPKSALDDAFLAECAAGFAGRLLAEGGETVESRIRLGFRLCTGRWPGPAEAAPLEEIAKGGDDGLRCAAEALLRLDETNARD